MDSLQLRAGGFLLFFDLFVVRPSSPRILPVCYAALCLLLIYVCLLIEKKKLYAVCLAKIYKPAHG